MTPRILCLHGGGASAAIFRIQCHRLVTRLQGKSEFIFIDGPIASDPGPGVLPFFEDFDAFYRWYSDQDYTTSGLAALSQNLENALGRQGLSPADITGVLGFSQGAAAACMLLLQARLGDARWSGLGFAVLICGACSQNLIDLVGDPLSIRSMHVHGLEDQWISNGRMLSTCFDPKLSETIEFQGDHHIPRSPHDIDRLIKFILEAIGS